MSPWLRFLKAFQTQKHRAHKFRVRKVATKATKARPLPLSIFRGSGAARPGVISLSGATTTSTASMASKKLSEKDRNEEIKSTLAEIE